MSHVVVSASVHLSVGHSDVLCKNGCSDQAAISGSHIVGPRGQFRGLFGPLKSTGSLLLCVCSKRDHGTTCDVAYHQNSLTICLINIQTLFDTPHMSCNLSYACLCEIDPGDMQISVYIFTNLLLSC